MQGHRFQQTVHVPGTLTANLDIRLKIPFDCRLKHISAVAANDGDATLAVGVSTDTDSILAAAAIGDNQVPVEKTVSDWATTNPTGALSKGDILVLTLDYDGASGTAAADVTVALSFLEG